MNVYLWILGAVIIGVFYLGGFIFFFPTDKKMLEAQGKNKKSLIIDSLLGVIFVVCLILAIYIYTIINQQLLQYSR